MNQPSNAANTALQPYGQQAQPFVPPPIKRPGATSAKVWGILLLLFGFMGVFSVAATAAMSLGTFSGSSFVPGLDDQARSELDELVRTSSAEALSRWTFWFWTVSEAVIAVISIAAGVRLAVRPKATGRSLAVARALIVLLFLPFYGIENVAALDSQLQLQESMNRRVIERRIKEEAGNASQKEVERRQKEAAQFLDSFNPIVRGGAYGAVIFTAVCILVINGLLLLFISKPAVKEYLESVEKEGDHAIPQFDPSMGLMMGPPPGGHDPPKTTGSPPQDKPL